MIHPGSEVAILTLNDDSISESFMLNE